MTAPQDSADKTHYVCQTYMRQPGKSRQGAGLKVDKLFQYTSADQAQSRAEREFQREDCIGADAYMIVEDAGSGEVSAPDFLVRLGEVPEFDDF